MLHYQHYKPLNSLLAEQPWLIALLIVQSVLVLIALARRFNLICNWLKQAFRLWPLIIVAAVCIGSAAALSRDVRGYFLESAWATWLQLINLGNLILVLWSLPEGLLSGIQKTADRLFNPNQEKFYNLDWFAILGQLWVFVVSGLLAILSYQQHPHIPDEVASIYYTTRFLAAGSWSLPAPIVPSAFDIYLMQFKAKEWFAATPPDRPPCSLWASDSVCLGW